MKQNYAGSCASPPNFMILDSCEIKLKTGTPTTDPPCHGRHVGNHAQGDKNTRKNTLIFIFPKLEDPKNLRAAPLEFCTR